MSWQIVSLAALFLAAQLRWGLLLGQLRSPIDHEGCEVWLLERAGVHVAMTQKCPEGMYESYVASDEGAHFDWAGVFKTDSEARERCESLVTSKSGTIDPCARYYSLYSVELICFKR